MTRKSVFNLMIVLVLLTTLIALSTLLNTRNATAHGSLSSPPSRAYQCNSEHPQAPTSLACQWALQVGGTGAFYSWFGTRQWPDGDHQAHVPDGQLCSAGNEKYQGLDLARDDWPATVIEEGTQSIEMEFWAWAPHRTLYMDFYITKDDYDPLVPLKWSDLEATPFCTHTETILEEDKYYRMNCTLPEKTGRHVIYNVWQRSDSAEAFYGCSDVFFEDENNPAPVIETPVEGQCNANPWLSNVTYFAGYLAIHNGKEYKANYWTNNDLPDGDDNNAWTETAVCDGTVPTATPVTPTETPVTPTPTPVTPTPEPTPTVTPTDQALLQLPEVTVANGQQASLVLTGSNLENLSSATVHIDYDTAVVVPAGCNADPNGAFDLGLCNIQSDIGRISLSLLDSAGESGDRDLAQLTFNAIGTNNTMSLLAISAETFANNSGTPHPVTVDDGQISINLTQGDVDCNSESDTIDALFILQYSVGSRLGTNDCPPSDGAMFVPACDVNGSNGCDVVDGLFVLQCVVGINNALCPAPQDLSQRLATANANEPSDLQLTFEQVDGSINGTISAEIPASNPLAATTLHLAYDATYLTPASCTVGAGLNGVCNIAYTDGVVALSLISAEGVSGSAEIATVQFDVIEGGEAEFFLTAPHFQDANGISLTVNETDHMILVANAPSAVQVGQLGTNRSPALPLLAFMAIIFAISFAAIRQAGKN